MNTTTPEKEWLQRFGNNKCQDDAVKNQKEAAKESNGIHALPKHQGTGFADVAGMNQLKELVIEGFINVLRNRDCAEAYGIKPPSLLFYAPAGCGKTFFAEKIAEELGIHFMKIVPDDLACTWIHGTQQKIGELFREAEKKAPTLMFFDEFDAMVPKRTGNETSQSYNGEVNEFLCMLNKANERGIYVLAATNHPELIDKDTLELSEIILALADDLSTGCMLTTSLCMPQGTPEGKQWFERYVLMKPANIGRSCQLYTDKCTS